MADLSDDLVYLPDDNVVSRRLSVASCELSGSFASSVSSSSSDESIVGTPTKRTVVVYCPNKHWGCQWDGSLDTVAYGVYNHVTNLILTNAQHTVTIITSSHTLLHT